MMRKLLQEVMEYISNQYELRLKQNNTISQLEVEAYQKIRLKISVRMKLFENVTNKCTQTCLPNDPADIEYKNKETQVDETVDTSNFNEICEINNIDKGNMDGIGKNSFTDLAVIATKPEIGRRFGLKLKCEFCKNEFTDALELQRHVRSHNKTILYQCKICHLKYTQLRDLQWHILIHKKNLNAVSPKSFQASKLETCKASRPFKCTRCPKDYRSKKNLNEHICKKHGKHAKMKPNSNNFNQSNAELNAHKTKLLTRSFPCLKCPKAYQIRKHLNEHIRKMHKEIPCTDCGKICHTARQREIHVLTCVSLHN